MKNWSLNSKIYSVVGLLIVSVIGVGTFSLFEIKKLDVSIDQITQSIVPRVVMAGQLMEESRSIAVDERDFYLSETDVTKKATQARLDSNKAKLDADYDALWPRLSPEGKEFAKKYKAGFDAYWKSVETVKNLIAEHKDEKNDHLIREAIFHGNGVRREALTHLQEIIDLNEGRLEKATTDADDLTEQSKKFVFILTILSTVFGTLLSIITMRALSRTVDRVISSLSGASQQVAQASEQIAQAAEQLSQSSNEQASSLQETSAATEQVNSMVQKNTENARSTADSSQRSLKSAQNGKETVEGMVEAIRKLEASNQEIAAIVNVFTEIQEKTKVIDEIVFQTQLLSFNASVEAARAGEHGKGFAVVAEEVGNLAEMSGSASGEIGHLLADSLKRVENTVQGVQNQIARLVEEGNRGISVLDEIVQEVQTANHKTLEISQASEEQSRGIREISLAMNQLDQSTQQNAATSEETASASEELSGQAVALKNTVQELVGVIKGGAAVVHIDEHSHHHAAGSPPRDRASNHHMHSGHVNHGSKKVNSHNQVIPMKLRAKPNANHNAPKLAKAVGAEDMTSEDDEKDFVNL